MQYNNTNMIVIGGSNANNIDKNLIKLLNAKGANLVHKRFPDGEQYVRIEDSLAGKTVVIVQSLYPNQDSALMELLLILEAVQALKPARVITVVPYLAYARQDKRFLTGEPISVRVVLEALNLYTKDTLITIDIHKPESLKYFKGTSMNIIPVKSIANALRRDINGLEKRDVVVIAPDKGAFRRAELLAKELGDVDYDYLEKFRDRHTGEVIHKLKEVNVRGRIAILVDDIISTGGTIAKAAKMLYDEGAREVIAACSHGLFVDNALNKLAGSKITKVYSTNTVPQPSGVRVVDVSTEIAERIKEVVKS
ncbi:MAG: ribose-phosphate pyrophosphokinase [Pyrodictiaceae archaeon]